MSEITFMEEGAYLFAPVVSGREDGLWEVAVLFERLADHQRDRIPAIRHKLRTVFDTREEARQAGMEHGYASIRQEDVGLPRGSSAAGVPGALAG